MEISLITYIIIRTPLSTFFLSRNDIRKSKKKNRFFSVHFRILDSIPCDTMLKDLNEFHPFRFPIDWLEFDILTLTITMIKIPSIECEEIEKFHFRTDFPSILLSSRSSGLFFFSFALIF